MTEIPVVHGTESPSVPVTSGPRVVLAGGSGFLGQALAGYLAQRGWKVVVLTRTSSHVGGPFQQVSWDGRTLGSWSRALEGATAVINLAGRSVNCRYHARNRRVLIDSRVEPTRVLGLALASCSHPPKVWLNASTATIYRHTFASAWDEDGETGADPAARDAFSIEIARAWEQEFAAAKTPGVRKVTLRSAMVLGRGANSVFPTLERLTRWGLGGPMAGGPQFVSWIHEKDFCRAVEWLIAAETASGIFNLAAPSPMTNAELMAKLRQACGVRMGLPAPRWLLEIGAWFLRTETELILKSRRVISRRLAEGGFQFLYPNLQDALLDLVKGRSKAPYPERDGALAGRRPHSA